MDHLLGLMTYLTLILDCSMALDFSWFIKRILVNYALGTGSDIKSSTQKHINDTNLENI